MKEYSINMTEEELGILEDVINDEIKEYKRCGDNVTVLESLLKKVTYKNYSKVYRKVEENK